MAKLILIEDFAGPSVLGRGGAATYVLQWAHGLRRLGHEVLLLEMLTEPPADGTVRAFERLTRRCWTAGQAALLTAADPPPPAPGEQRTAAPGGRVAPPSDCAGAAGERGAAATAAGPRSLAGASVDRVRRFAREADAVVTLAAHYRREPWPLVEHVRPRIVVDQDPGYTQLWAHEAGDATEVWGEHDLYFTVGLNVGSERCALPTCGIDWRPIVNPVVLDWWRVGRPIERDRFTTVASWRDYGYLEYEGTVLGPKVEQWQRLLDLPARSGERPELVVDLHPKDPDRARLLEHGWRLQDPQAVATPERYRDYLEGSLGELSVAKGGYVGTRSGWFSDRSACYLAAGRPVVLQATGFEQALPTGEGLLAFETLEQAAEAMARVRADYARHSRAARELAREHLACERVLPALLQAAGVR
jgi:hypothetical protein